MRVTLQLDDELAQHYLDEVNVPSERTIESILADRLARAVQLHPDRPYVIVTDNDLTLVEKELGGLPIRSCQTLLDRLKRLAKIRFGDHAMELTAGQMEEIAWRSVKQGKTVEFLVKAAWDRFCEEFFTLIPAKK